MTDQGKKTKYYGRILEDTLAGTAQSSSGLSVPPSLYRHIPHVGQRRGQSLGHKDWPETFTASPGQGEADGA